MKLAAEGVLEDALVSLSLANLCLLRVWGALFNPERRYFLIQDNHYFLRSAPGWQSFAVAPLFMFLLAAAFFVLGRLARKPGHARLHSVAPWGFLGASIVALNGLRQHVAWLSLSRLVASPRGRALAMAVLVALAVVLAVVLASTRRRVRVLRGLRIGLLALTPFCLVTLGQDVAEAWSLRVGHRAAFEDKPTAPPLPAPTNQVRLVFLVFDSLDQNLLFSERPAGLRLPAFDRLRAEAVSATQAYSVSCATAVSLPSLVIGKRVLTVKRPAPDELLLWLEGAAEGVPWSEQDNLFRRARTLGLNGALVGWYHPYCRILAGDLVSCAWFPYVPDTGQSLSTAAGNQFALLVDTLPLAFRFDALEAVGLASLREADAPAWHVQQYQAVHARALAAITDPTLSLVFVHYPIPHWPNVYDRATGQFTDGGGEYADNLALADRTLGEIRQALASSKLSERSAILLTSDHFNRRAGWQERGEWTPVVGRQDERVPLLLTLPREGAAAVMEKPVLNIVAKDLALAVLRGELTRADQVAAWLQARSL